MVICQTSFVGQRPPHRHDVIGSPWDGKINRPHAERVVETHPLRAANALHIGAALVASEDNPATLEFVTLDRNLANAAEREGFVFLGP